MYLIDYLNDGNVLYTDIRELCDSDMLMTRIKLLFSYRTIRAGLSVSVIPQFAQNVIDTEYEFLKQLFDYSAQFNPQKQNVFTTTKTGDNSGTTGGTDTTDSTTHNTTTTNATNTTTATADTTRSAYNATENRPYETNAANNTATTTGTDNSDGTGKTTVTKSNTQSGKFSENTTVSGVSSADDIRIAFEKYIQPYDFLAREICNAVCDLVW